MSKIDLVALSEAIAQEYIEGIDLETALDILYDLKVHRLLDLNESDLLDVADMYDIDTKPFEVE